jgi:hypothetical protein
MFMKLRYNELTDTLSNPFFGTNQCCTMRVKFLAQGNKNLSLMRFEPMQIAIIRILVQCVGHSVMPPLNVICLTFKKSFT